VPKTYPRGTPLGGTVGGLGAPKGVTFVDYISRILQNVLFYFRVTSYIDSFLGGATFAIFRMGAKGVRTPPK